MGTSPSGYDRNYPVETPRGDCKIGVGFDFHRGDVERFLVQLQYLITPASDRWTEIARIDHNPVGGIGHDLYAEGLHVDVVRKDGNEVKLWPHHDPLPESPGRLIRDCVDYFRENTGYFVGIYQTNSDPNNPPKWP